MNYYERHIGDYLKDTAHLSLLEHGVYGRLLDVYYSKEVGIEEGMVARLVGARSDDELAALRIVLMEFFVLEAGVYTQRRCDEEIARYQDKQRKAKASADARWSHTERNATAMRTHTEGNAPSLQSPDTSLQTEAIASVAAKPPRPTRKCSESFAPQDPQAWTSEHCPGIDWQAETAKFRDHTFKNPISDWHGAWRNWLRRAFETKQQARASPLTFRERDAANAAARIHEMTGGLVSAKPITRRNDALQEVFDAPRLLG